MIEPTPPQSVARPARARTWHRALAALGPLAMILQVALALRIAGADAVDLYVHRGGSEQLCVFPDTAIYWGLARAIRMGEPFEYVEWSDIPHFCRRTPGYPLFLAACQALLGRRTLAVRIVQAGLGTLSVYLVYHLTRQLMTPDSLGSSDHTSRPGRDSAALIAGALAAVNPYLILMSVTLLSEAVFVPLMVAVLLGLAVLWGEPGRAAGLTGWRSAGVAFGSGSAAGAAILVRPSWALFAPLVLAIWVFTSRRERTALLAAARGTLFFSLGLVVVMSPWWVRNARIYGRFVPTSLWMGASLYDGLNPRATGASDMSFLDDREIWPLDEQDLDAALTERAISFARAQPLRVFSLAVVKLGRFWSPWPNAEGFRSVVLALASAIVEIPLFGLMFLGAWAHRRRPRVWALLAGPILYFCAIHLIFAGSMRYRIPGEMPALGLAAMGWAKAREWLAIRGC